MQGPGVDQRGAAVGVGAGQDPGPGVSLDQAEAGAVAVGDDAGNSARCAAAGQDQIGVGGAGIGDRAGQGQLAIGHHHRGIAGQGEHALDGVAAGLVDQAGGAIADQEPEVGAEGDRVGQADRADIAGIGGDDLLGTGAERVGGDGHRGAVENIQVGGEGIGATEGDGPAIDDTDGAGAGEAVTNRVGIAAGERQLGVVAHEAGPEQAAGAAVADLQRAAIEEDQPAVGVIAAQHNRVRAVLGEIAGAAQHPGEGQRAAAGAAEAEMAAEHHIVGDHKAAGAVLGEQRGQAGEGEIAARDELGEAGGIGQVDLFGDQAGQVIEGGVGAGGAAKIHDQVGGARGWDIAFLPLGGGAEGSGRIGPGEIIRAGVVQLQVGAAGQRQAPGAIVLVGEAAEVQAERVGDDAAAGGGDGKAVVAILVEVEHRPGGVEGGQGDHVDDKRVAAGGRVRQEAIDLEQIPAGGAGGAIDLPEVIAAAAQGERAGGGQGGRAVGEAGGDGAPPLDQHAGGAADGDGAGAGQGGQAVGDQQIVLHEQRPAGEGEAGRGNPRADREVHAIAEHGIGDGQRAAIEQQLSAAGGGQVAGDDGAGVELERAGIIDQQRRGTAGAGHIDGGAADHQPAVVGGQIADGAAGPGEGQGAGAHLAERAAAADQGPGKVCADIAKADLHRARADAELAGAAQQTDGSIVLEIHSPIDGDGRHIGHRRHIGPVEHAATGDRQIGAAEQLAADGQVAAIDQRIARVGIRAAQGLRSPTRLGQRAAAA